MARLKYLGHKEGYGPLSLKWMVGEIKFKDGISEEVDPETAEAACAETAGLFSMIETEPSPSTGKSPKRKPKAKKKAVK